MQEPLKHALHSQYAAIEATHPGLGRTFCAALVGAYAGEFVLIVGPSGTGKSVITDALESAKGNVIRLGRITRAGMGKEWERLTSFDGRVLIDDLGGVGKGYVLESMLLGLVELCHSHAMLSSTGLAKFDITDFTGSIVANIQPIILRTLVGLIEWESNIQDKTMRLYHLYRPVRPSLVKPQAIVYPQIPPEDVAFSELDTPEWVSLLKLGLGQWGRTRVRVHMDKLARTVAAIDGSDKVRPIDLRALLWLLRPLGVERFILERSGFEQGRSFNLQLLHLVSLFLTYPKIGLDEFAADYKIAPHTVYEIMDKHARYVRVIGRKPVSWGPSDVMRTIMEELGWQGKKS